MLEIRGNTLIHSDSYGSFWKTRHFADSNHMREDSNRKRLHCPGSRRRLEPVSGGWGSSVVPCNTNDQFFSVPDIHIQTCIDSNYKDKAKDSHRVKSINDLFSNIISSQGNFIQTCNESSMCRVRVRVRVLDKRVRVRVWVRVLCCRVRVRVRVESNIQLY